MSSYYGNGSWEENDQYASRPRSSRRPNPNRSSRPASDSEEDDLPIAQGAQPARPSGGSRFRNTNTNLYGRGYPPSRSPRPSQQSQVRYDAHEDRSPTHDEPAWSDDEYDEPRHPPARAQRTQRPDRGSQSTRGPQSSREPQPSCHRAPEPEYIYDPCVNGIHTGLERHCLGNDNGRSYWESRRHADIAAQCGEQCEGMPIEDCRITCVRPGLWELVYCRQGACRRGQRDGEPRHGGRHGGEARGEEARGEEARGGGRQPGGAGGLWYS